MVSRKLPRPSRSMDIAQSFRAWGDGEVFDAKQERQRHGRKIHEE